VSKITICIATYNGAKYLKEQLDSLANQTIQPYEVILQDDCSSDNTVEIAKTYQDKLNLKIFVNEINLGFTKNFESVLSKATGDFIAPCDQDDIWKSDKLELLLSHIGDSSLIYANSLLVDANGQSLNKTLSQKLRNNFIDSQSGLNFFFDNTVSAHAMLFKKEILEYIFPFPKITYFDSFIAASSASFGGIRFLDENLVLYRQHQTNTLSKTKSKKLSIFEKIKIKTEKKLRANNRLLEQIDEFLEIKTLKSDEVAFLLEFKKQLQKFENSWFNLVLFMLLYNNRNTIFAISTRNKIVLSIKKSIGYKLYKMAPFL